MHQRLIRAAAAATCGIGLLGSSNPAAHADSGPPPPPSTVEVVSTPTLGRVLADLDGMTLYRDTVEAGGMIRCTGYCLDTRIPLRVTPGQVLRMPPGYTGTLANIVRPDATTQVTFNGWPLYRYTGDQAEGDTTGDGVQWHVIPAPPITNDIDAPRGGNP